MRELLKGAFDDDFDAAPVRSSFAPARATAIFVKSNSFASRVKTFNVPEKNRSRGYAPLCGFS
jgi:hypothetical protein